MKKILMIPALAIFLLTAGCGGLSGDTAGTTAVTITVGKTGIAGAVSTTSAIPSAVASIRITVSADDMATVEKIVQVAGESSITVTLDILNGPDRHIVLEAMTASGTVLYRGETWVDLDGKALTITINLSATTTCRLYVDVNTGADDTDCSNPDTPCRTITYALTQTDGDEEICVEAGTYDSAAGERFPLTLKQGTSLKCRGDEYSTIISGGGTIIEGAAGASVEGCRLSINTASAAIYDNGAAITVNDCLIEGAGYDISGISLSADSTVSNSTIRNFQQGEVGGSGIIVSSGSPSITNNTITGNSYGIYVLNSSNPSVTGNTITDNRYGIYIVNSSAPVINNNILSCNTGVDLLNTTAGNINARSNQWDNSTPSEISGTCSLSGEDICNSGSGSVDYTGSTQAASPC
ncbi:MAG: DUF1565 domain-containing protein [Deferribacteres bacterium]|nr:DUF1565 domain-containing protein [Deferribacteres bacterium]